MELSNTEIKIVVKNMAREMVKRATAKNGRGIATNWVFADEVEVEFIENGINKRKSFDTYEVAEKWAKSKGLKKGDPHGSERENEYRIVAK